MNCRVENASKVAGPTSGAWALINREASSNILLHPILSQQFMKTGLLIIAVIFMVDSWVQHGEYERRRPHVTNVWHWPETGMKQTAILLTERKIRYRRVFNLEPQASP